MQAWFILASCIAFNFLLDLTRLITITTTVKIINIQTSVIMIGTPIHKNEEDEQVLEAEAEAEAEVELELELEPELPCAYTSCANNVYK